METKEKKTYSGEYKNITFSIDRFEPFICTGNDYSWTHYIYINLDNQIKDKKIADKLWLNPKYDDKNRVSYNYYYDSIINNIVFHGGCTWYSKESSVDDKYRVIKIGCDYQHSWDDNKNYCLEYIKEQVMETIDSFIENVSPVLKHCSGCGVYYEDVTKNGCGKCKYSKDIY